MLQEKRNIKDVGDKEKRRKMWYKMNKNKEVIILLLKKDCRYLKADIEGHIQDTEEALAETSDSLLSLLYKTNLRYWKRILFSLKKSLEAEESGVRIKEYLEGTKINLITGQAKIMEVKV